MKTKTKSAAKRVAAQKTKTVSAKKPNVRRVTPKQSGVTLAPQLGFTSDALDALIASRPFEPEWMRDRRRDSFHVLMDTPLPTRTDEAWRRTDFGSLRLKEIESVMSAIDGNTSIRSAPKSIKEVVNGKSTSASLVLAEGETVANNVAKDLAKRGVIFTDMDTAIQKHADLIEPLFMTDIVKPNDGYFAALHGAFWQGGSFLYVPGGVEVPQPIRSGTWLNQHRSSFTHTLIVMEPGSRAVFIDEYASATGDKQAFANGAVEIVVRDGAQLDYVNWQDWGRNIFNFTHERAKVMRDATLHWIAIGLGTKLTKSFIDAVLAGQGSTALMSGAYFVDSNQHLDYDTEQNHMVPHTKSDLLYKGALKDKARSVWQGNIHVFPGAQRTDAYQANRNLTLSHTARADSIPGLEIEADDVRCTHGAAISQVDREEVFYLMSRGLPQTVAEQMIVTGFFQPVLDRIPMASVRTRLETSFALKMGLA
ncbi:MAG TPA: Fe-S cluster assembly protein SufD [Anaerolineae bacterium]|nr:Fe-S cluster assembly protein SufD [Anaerolineae bacterium]